MITLEKLQALVEQWVEDLPGDTPIILEVSGRTGDAQEARVENLDENGRAVLLSDHI